MMIAMVDRARWIPVFIPGTNKLVFKFDPDRMLIEYQERRVKYVIDLTQVQAPESAQESAGK